MVATEQTYYRWEKEYGGLRMDQAKRLKELENENARLKRLLADAELDQAILKETALQVRSHQRSICRNLYYHLTSSPMP
ncbi:hypothetical protein PLANPX_4832 [Lacipirellula parvula]|uniref:Mobile element protein n=1 Tax=Lacipirellula parvula TaxID=2650471 RepID=A0A5K7XEJ5_9BACT|nr:hypothetical protein PLANPX_4832 [Lacipirellula parvula]